MKAEYLTLLAFLFERIRMDYWFRYTLCVVVNLSTWDEAILVRDLTTECRENPAKRGDLRTWSEVELKYVVTLLELIQSPSDLTDLRTRMHVWATFGELSYDWKKEDSLYETLQKILALVRVEQEKRP